MDSEGDGIVPGTATNPTLLQPAFRLSPAGGHCGARQEEGKGARWATRTIVMPASLTDTLRQSDNDGWPNGLHEPYLNSYAGTAEREHPTAISCPPAGSDFKPLEGMSITLVIRNLHQLLHNEKLYCSVLLTKY